VEERAAAALEVKAQQELELELESEPESELEPAPCALGAVVVPERMAQLVASQAVAAAKAPPSPVMEELEEPSEPRLELPPPRKIKVFDGGWKSDDTKVFDIDKGHTHTHISKYSQVS
jgi:hypothetical protein